MSPARTRHISAQLKRVLVLIFTFVVAPSAALLSVGILVLAMGRASRDVVFGVLIVSLVLAMGFGSAAALFYVFRSASLARLQTEFVSRVSHELRTPLTSIRMFLETLQLGRAQDPETTRQCLELMQAETMRLSAMIDRLLHWGRMEAGRRPYSCQPHPPAAIVERALAAFAPQLAQTPATIVTEVAPDLPDVIVDLDAVAEAVLNLLQNAHRYTGPEKQITVRAGLRRKDVFVSVTDNGPGIPEQERRRIFDKFYRGSHAEAMEVPGSGLGLAIVDHVVRGHRGRVQVESEPGHGATFTILLPSHREK
ncbi:MAG TPA: ATP-binding protein [Polyangia bacterium]|jgi:two-component system phosphate regulon sensor histidine kinase PhoR